MSKAIRVIDLLNKIADREELPKKILILDEVYYLINDEDGNIVYSQLKDRREWEAFIDHKLNITKCLHEDVIILDDETEIIEEQEVDYWEEIANTFREYGETLAEKFAKIGRQLDKKIKEK